MKILLAEDDLQLANNLLDSFKGHGFSADHATNGEDALYLARNGPYDIMVLDLGLPKVDGIEVLTNLRKTSKNLPVLILTARDEFSDKSAGFKAGADDYLTKPFLPGELMLRLNALVRRAQGYVAQTVSCGALSYDPVTSGFALNHAPVRLTAFEHRILGRLFQSRENVVERDSLIDAAYNQDSDVPFNSLEVLIGRLRRKIGRSRIVTVRGMGYMLTAQ